jgi:transposase
MRHRNQSQHDSAIYRGLRGDLQVTFEEGTSAAWLYDLLKPHVTKLVVCDPRKNKSMREGNQSDKIDARQLAELLRLDHLTPVYHGEHGLRTLKELVRSYLTVSQVAAELQPFLSMLRCVMTIIVSTNIMSEKKLRRFRLGGPKQ